MNIKKLRNNSGASLVTAMIALLIVTVLASLMLTVAQANGARVKREKQFEQAYLTVESAATMIRDGFENDQITYEIVIRKLEQYYGNKIINTTEYAPEIKNFNYIENLNGTDNPLKALILEAVKENVEKGNLENASSFSKTLTIKASLDDHNMDDVICQLQMNGYNVICTFSLANNPDINYTMTLYLNVRISDPTIEKSNESSDVEYKANYQYVTTYNTISYSISYTSENIHIEKGAAE